MVMATECMHLNETWQHSSVAESHRLGGGKLLMMKIKHWKHFYLALINWVLMLMTVSECATSHGGGNPVASSARTFGAPHTNHRHWLWPVSWRGILINNRTALRGLSWAQPCPRAERSARASARRLLRVEIWFSDRIHLNDDDGGDEQQSAGGCLTQKERRRN